MFLKHLLYLIAFVSAAPTSGSRSNGSCNYVTVAPGDTCWEIAERYGVSVDDIERWNLSSPNWSGRDLIIPGMKICVSPGIHPDLRPTITRRPRTSTVILDPVNLFSKEHQAANRLTRFKSNIVGLVFHWGRDQSARPLWVL
jgi:LysM repeat protein